MTEENGDPLEPVRRADDATTIQFRPVRLPRGEAQWPVVVAKSDDARMAKALRRLANDPPAADADPSWELALVVDDHPSMPVWTETIDEFARQAERSGQFTQVRRWRMRVPSVVGASPNLYEPEDDSRAQPPEQLISPDRKRLILVFTDGAAPGWRFGVPSAALRGWGDVHCVAIVHVLPQPMWRRTGIAGERLSLLPAGEGQSNSTLGWRPLDLTLGPEPPAAEESAEPAGEEPTVAPAEAESMPVPILELDPQWIGAWTRLISEPATGAIDLPCLLLPAAGHTVATREAAREAAAARAGQITTFRAAASPEAFELATYLAAAPLNLAIMRLIQARLMPQSRPEHLAEIFVAGLLHPVRPNPAADASGLITHAFTPGARAELLAESRQAATNRVVRLLDTYVGDHVPGVRRMAASVANPALGDVAQVADGERWIAEIHATVLQALSGRYQPLAGRIKGLVDTATDAAAEAHHRSASTEPVEEGMSLTQDPGPATATGGEPPPARPAVKVPSIWGSVPPRNPNFTGRLDLLEQLKARLVGGTTAVLPEALHGMGGVGKTQVVIEFVYLNAGDYDVIWWIPAERPSQIAAAMVELAQKLGLPVKAEAAAVPAVREALRIGHPYTNWLLIFDNADSPETVRQYFPMGGPGHILVTSRNPQWAAVARAVEVDVFRREESKALLTRRAPSLSQVQANDLAEVLGDLPLAIEQAAAWLAETGMPAQEYLSLFQEKRMELMEMSPPADYQIPVAAAWNVSLDHLARSRPASLRLLQLCAFLAPEPISRSLLSGERRMQISPELDSALRDPIQLGRAIREINRYALARIDHAKNTIQMHRLVQAVLIERMTPDERIIMQHGAHQLLATNDPQQPAEREHWSRYGELYPHLVASNAITDAEEPWVRQLVINEAKYHSFWGNPQESLEISEKAYSAWRERLGEESPQTLEMGRWLGFILFAVGRYQEAARLNADLLETYQRLFGEDHEDTLEAIQAVASDRRVQGRFQEALELSQTVYDSCVRLFGDDDPLTLNAAHNLAVSLRLAGRFEGARDIDQATYERKIQIFGQNHEESLRAMRGVLIDRRQLGDYIISREEFERLGKTFVDSLGERDPQTVETNRSLSVTRRKAGDHDAALAMSTDALLRYESAFGADNPGTMAAALNLSLDLRQAGQFDKAEEVATENYQRFRQTLGKRHPHALAAAGNLAIILRLKDDLEGARRLNEATLTRLAEELGDDHVLTLSCATNLASDIFAAGDIDTARERDETNLVRYRSAIGEDHPSTLAAALNLAIDLRGLDRTEEAYELHADTLSRFHQVLGTAHPATRGAAQWERANCDMDPMPL